MERRRFPRRLGPLLYLGRETGQTSFQATARDCLANIAILRLDEADYKIVMHVPRRREPL